MAQLFRNIGSLLTLEKAASQKMGRKISYEDLSVIENAALLEHNGQIFWAGRESDLTIDQVRSLIGTSTLVEIDLGAATCLPSFVECHTHLVHAGDRRAEFELRNQGVSYLEIAQRGGGILSTVRATRESSTEKLINESQERLNRFISQGVTTCEIKSGYGLDLATELKMLQVARALKNCEIVTTFLGPHAFPSEMSKEAYFDLVMNEMLPQVAASGLADRVDIFIENGFFTKEQGQQYFEKAQSLGLSIVAHVEQMSHQGGVELAVQHQALSIDHVVHMSDLDIQKVAQAKTVAVLLPAADFYLKIAYPKARALVDSGAQVALATDFNPGSSPTQDLSFVGVLARLEMKMSLPEVIVAYTYNAACALKREHQVGAITPGRRADFVVLSDDFESLFYQVGYHPIAQVYRGGQRVVG